MKFREAYYADHLRAVQCDSRETVPVALTLFELADGESELAIWYGANFGRDADTIATMIGGLAGAFRGASGLPSRWVEKIESTPRMYYQVQTPLLLDIIQMRAKSDMYRAQLLLLQE